MFFWGREMVVVPPSISIKTLLSLFVSGWTVVWFSHVIC